MQGSFDFTEQKEIVNRVRRKPFEARQDWQRAPKIIVTDEHIALDKKLEPIEEELFDLIKKMPLVVEKKIKGKICFIETGNKMDESLVNRVRQLRKQASKIGRELDELFFKTNPEWARFYEYTNKT